MLEIVLLLISPLGFILSLIISGLMDQQRESDRLAASAVNRIAPRITPPAGTALYRKPSELARLRANGGGSQ